VNCDYFFVSRKVWEWPGLVFERLTKYFRQAGLPFRHPRSVMPAHHLFTIAKQFGNIANTHATAL
jgi:hypothetical protein